MNKAELVEHVAAKHGVEKTQAESILTTILDTIMTSVANGELVRLRDFGTFDAVDSKPRVGFVPGTREKILIPAARRPRFTPGVEFKRKVSANDQE